MSLRANRITPEMLAQAEEVLKDGATYSEAGRTVGLNRNTIRRHLPGYGMTDAESASFTLALRRIAEKAKARGIDLTDLARLHG